jgi:hypothetical protein
MMYLFSQKMVWATFWAIFSQAHPVTLKRSFFFCCCRGTILLTRSPIMIMQNNCSGGHLTPVEKFC